MFLNKRYFLAFLVVALAGCSPMISKEQNLNSPHTNRLVREKSPYLLQHAHNPVDWYPWGQEAFEKAAKEDKPIFLSIGYSTCHWCHVMEEESFSNLEIAGILNKYFVPIKVDREERPDLDNIYMNAVTALTGSGGWPLNVFLSPDLKPFYGGTYFPAEDKWGRPGLRSVLRSIAQNWQNQKEKILNSARELTGFLEKQLEVKVSAAGSLDEAILKKAYEYFYSSFDSEYGGFSQAPKFPSGYQLSFLLRYWKRTKDNKALEMVEKTLTEIAKGGIHDHIGGGFHRYSTDQKWFLPHFEKMLYDQAILSRAYLEAYQATGKKEYAQSAREIFEYVLRDMAGPEGGFYSAEDADSLPLENPKEEREGAFYVWSEKEISNILSKTEAGIFNYYFGVLAPGNVSADPSGDFQGKNILYIAHSLEETARHFGQTPAETEKNISASQAKLFTARSSRPRPHLDDKILVDWNGLMISALAFGSRALNEPRYCLAAENSARFILKNLLRKDARLWRRFRDGEAAIEAMLDDYAFFIHGLIDLYEATFNPVYLKEARKLTRNMLQLFWDDKDGGFFFVRADTQNLIFRRKELYDGALPSGNSIAALDLIRLGRLLMDRELEAKAETIFKTFSGQISQLPNAYAQALIALDFAFGPSKEIVLAAEADAPETKQMLKSIYRRFIPNKVVAFHPAQAKEAKEIISLIPFLNSQLPLEGKATAYVCANYVCLFPVTTVGDLEKLLDAKI